MERVLGGSFLGMRNEELGWYRKWGVGKHGLYMYSRGGCISVDENWGGSRVVFLST